MMKVDETICQVNLYTTKLHVLLDTLSTSNETSSKCIIKIRLGIYYYTIFFTY